MTPDVLLPQSPLHCLGEEDKVPTYQVTQVGLDGMVVASDRCEAWRNSGGRGSTTQTRTRKIFISRDKSFAWTFSGGLLSGIAAEYLRQKDLKNPLNEHEIEGALRESGNEAGQQM